ncbi:hypothetical protein [Candidatus Nanohalovita haloferacivicina]|uniref:hypothetical protein n=1 Tax=Candidatus Nanohalovita haloferacivicina TaxID=2978046 RepID=UPI00325FB9DE|nr:putative membrane protein [Candidatus Nanohalobia archaeon BNXNv]
MFSINLDYYDKILAGITTSLVAGGSVGAVTKISVAYTLGAGAAIALVLMYDGMFRNGPLG